MLLLLKHLHTRPTIQIWIQSCYTEPYTLHYPERDHSPIECYGFLIANSYSLEFWAFVAAIHPIESLGVMARHCNIVTSGRLSPRSSNSWILFPFREDSINYNGCTGSRLVQMVQLIAINCNFCPVGLLKSMTSLLKWPRWPSMQLQQFRNGLFVRWMWRISSSQCTRNRGIYAATSWVHAPLACLPPLLCHLQA